MLCCWILPTHIKENWNLIWTVIVIELNCDLKEIQLKTMKIQWKTHLCVLIMRLRIASKISLIPDKPLRGINGCVDKLINFEGCFSGLEESTLNPGTNYL